MKKIRKKGDKMGYFINGNVVEAREAQEHIEEVTSMDLPLEWTNFYDSDDSTIGVEAVSISDGLIKSLNNLGRVDIEYIASITKEDYKTVINTLKGSIYQNPATWGECFFLGWETKEEYVSGNIMNKLREARQSNKDYNGYFADNVRVLEEALPENASYKDIYITLGSPWVPTSVISDFIEHIIYPNGRIPYSYMRKYDVLHDEMTGSWEYGFYTMYSEEHGYASIYGTKRRSAFDILLRTLNMQSVAVYDTKKSDVTKSGTVKVINKEETVEALEKQKKMIAEFQKWVWEDKNRRAKLVEIYEDRYMNVRKRQFSGAFLEFPEMDSKINLYPYQKDAVARIIFTPNTLLAHDVGSGKTYIMVAAGMELKRMKLSDKNLYVVPNNIVGQWKDIFLSLYPKANIITVEPKNFTLEKRQSVLKKIRDTDSDAIIMAYSCFSQIPISKECKINMLNLEIKKLEESYRIKGRATRRLSSRLDKLRELRLDMESICKREDSVYFDQLGISRLFVDEAHNFKNVPIETKIDNVMGISKTGSIKCSDMMDKVRIIQHNNGGKGVVLATGTPITNSITDAYIMQSYLQSGELALMDLQSFDSWVGMFAERATNFEIDVDTSSYRLATRFSKFHNVPELTMMLASVADFHQVDGGENIPTHNGYTDDLVRKTSDFNEYLKDISKRADKVRNGKVHRAEDNMLKITTDGRKAALDIRLVNDKALFTTSSKVFHCAENIARIYRNTEEARSTQLIFCDTSTPKQGFNIYDELRLLLKKMGVDENEIAYIHDATTERKREKLYSQVRNGEIRILIGSTFKLGLGVNVQDKLIALHHLDVPWRPADMVQREGRILRQGNENKKVQIYRYITEGSFDAYSWQLLETKQQFIVDILSGTIEERDGSDIDDTVLNYAEVKALAVGNPLVKERVELANELSRYQILQRKLIAARMKYESEVSELPGLIERLKDLKLKHKEDVEYYARNKVTYEDIDEKRKIKEAIYNATHTEEPTKEEKVIMKYQGFDVIVPARVSIHNPVIVLKRAGRYTVELTLTDMGSMLRIDRKLEGLADDYEKLCKRLIETENRLDYMRTELAKDESYVEKIEQLKARIEEIDEKLGVEKNEK